MVGINHETWVVYYCYTHIRLSRSLDLSLDRSHPARPAWNCGGPGHSRPRNREVARKMLSPPPVSVTTVAKRTPSQAPCSSRKNDLGMFQVPATQLTSRTSCCTVVHLALGLKPSFFAVLLVEAKSDQLLDKFHVPRKHCTSEYPIPIISCWMNSTTTERSVFDPRNTSLDPNSFNKSKHVSPGPIHTNPQPIQNRSCFTRTA